LTILPTGFQDLKIKKTKEKLNKKKTKS